MASSPWEGSRNRSRRAILRCALCAIAAGVGSTVIAAAEPTGSTASTATAGLDFTGLVRSSGGGAQAAALLGLVNLGGSQPGGAGGTGSSSTPLPQPEDDNDPVLTDEDEFVTSPPDDQMRFFITPKFQYVFDSEFDEPGNDSFSVYRVGGDLGLSAPLNEQTRLLFTFGYEFNSYDFDAPNTFFDGASSDPFSDIHILQFGVDAFGRTSREWGWFAGLSAEFAGESEVDWDDATTFGGKAGLTWSPNEEFSVSLGVFAKTQLEDDVLVLPAAAVNWQFAETWALSFQGTRGEVVHNLTSDLDVAFGAAWESRRFRLDDDTITQGSVVEESAIPVYLRLAYRLDQRSSIELVGGARFGQEFEIVNERGNNERNFDADPTGFFGAALTWRF